MRERGRRHTQVILLDELDLLAKVMPFIRCLNDYLILRNNGSGNITRNTTAHRISRMDTAQAASIRAGSQAFDLTLHECLINI
jgi:hypothetical protein